MITLQQLLMSDSDLSGGMQTGKGTDGAQDFYIASDPTKRIVSGIFLYGGSCGPAHATKCMR